MGYEVDVLEEKGMQEVQISGEINFFSMSVKVLDFLPKVDMIFQCMNKLFIIDLFFIISLLDPDP